MLANRLRMSGGDYIGDVPAGAVLFGGDGTMLVAQGDVVMEYKYPKTGLLVFRDTGDYLSFKLPTSLKGSLLIVGAGGRGGNGWYSQHGGRAGGGIQSEPYRVDEYTPSSLLHNARVGAANGGASWFDDITVSGGSSGGHADIGTNGADRPIGNPTVFLGTEYANRHDRRSNIGAGVAGYPYRGWGGQPGFGTSQQGGNGSQGIILFAFGGFAMNYDPQTNVCS